MSLATTVIVLENRRDTIATELSTMGAMGPNFSLDGVSIDNVAYAQALRKELTDIQLAIDAMGGPCIVRTIGR